MLVSISFYVKVQVSKPQQQQEDGSAALPTHSVASDPSVEFATVKGAAIAEGAADEMSAPTQLATAEQSPSQPQPRVALV